jgi:4-hydroxy-2-oxoheptanedioate aldolase
VKVAALAAFLILLACAAVRAQDGSPQAEATVGPRTTTVERARYAEIRYVSERTGSDETGDGTAERPWATIGHALERIADAAADRRVAILVAEGMYAATIAMRPHVDLLGGHDPDDWSRDVVAHPTILDGQGARRIAIGADDAMLDGFVLRNGNVQGHGGALLAEGVSPTISNNVFERNRTTRPVPWAPAYLHETAHDGGAIACRNGCSVVVENNLFVDNATEVGRGGAFACDNEATRSRPAAPRVARNVFLGNAASAARFAADTMRSGDGGAVSFYGYCDGVIADNVVAGNVADSRNDGGGIFVAFWAAPEVLRNVIVGNASGDDAGGLFVGGQKHHYGTPEDPVPPADEYSVRVIGNVFMGNRNGAPSSGAFRATMQSRAVFYNNVTADNPGGVHTQSSDLMLAHNTFADGARYEGSERASPGPTVFRNNIILGTKNWEEPVTDERNDCTDPRFVQDEFEIVADGAIFEPSRHVTRVRFDGASQPPGSLARRVVRTGERWGVVRSNDTETVEIWGDFAEERRLAVQPSYHLADDSPCIDRGAPIDAPDRDIDGDPRPIGPAPDLGADEHRPSQTAARPPTSETRTAKRINKAIELLEQGQPIYYASGAGGYEEGQALAKTWADYILYDMEHAPFDVTRLGEFMRGLVDGGPTPSGHRTPAVIVTLPAGGLDEETMRANAWMVQQVLATGVHGIHLVRARSPEAVEAFVQAARYPIHHQAEDVLGVGSRGWGSQRVAAEIWGVDSKQYLRIADVWPLNPEGEILLGVKIEDPEALENAEETVRVPGLAFAEHGPRDMGLSYGYLEGRADPPVPPEVEAAGERVLAATKAAGIFFLDNVLPDNVCERIEQGVMIGAGRLEEAAEVGRRCTKREMPW